jgi:hypothetical protein
MPVNLSSGCQSISLGMAQSKSNIIRGCHALLSGSEQSFSFLLDADGSQLLTSDGQRITVRN